MALCHASHQTVNRDSFLLTCIAMANGYRILKFRFLAECGEINSNAVRRAYLILPAVALADVAVVVPHDLRHEFLEHRVHLARFCDEFRLIFEERKDGGFDGCDRLVEFEVRACLPTKLIFRVGGGEQCEQCTVYTERGLDDVRHESLASIFEI